MDLRRGRVHILASIVAARVLGLEEFGVFATALFVVGFFQALLDLTVEESLTKYGFRYVAAEDWGRLRRLFRQMLLFKSSEARSQRRFWSSSLLPLTRSSAKRESEPRSSPQR